MSKRRSANISTTTRKETRVREPRARSRRRHIYMFHNHSWSSCRCRFCKLARHSELKIWNYDELPDNSLVLENYLVYILFDEVFKKLLKTYLPLERTKLCTFYDVITQIFSFSHTIAVNFFDVKSTFWHLSYAAFIYLLYTLLTFKMDGQLKEFCPYGVMYLECVGGHSGKDNIFFEIQNLQFPQNRPDE